MNQIIDALRNGRASILDQRRAADRISKLESALEAAASKLEAAGEEYKARWLQESAEKARDIARDWEHR